MEGTVYLLHFLEPIGNPANPHAMAQHYIGVAADPSGQDYRLGPQALAGVRVHAPPDEPVTKGTPRKKVSSAS